MQLGTLWHLYQTFRSLFLSLATNWLSCRKHGRLTGDCSCTFTTAPVHCSCLSLVFLCVSRCASCSYRHADLTVLVTAVGCLRIEHGGFPQLARSGYACGCTMGYLWQKFCAWMQAQDAEEVQKLIDRARQTPKGQKKDVSGAMFKGYTPAAVEAGW